MLDHEPVKAITPYLSRPGRVTGEPYRLKANEGKSFIGSYVLGMGFVMNPEDAQALITMNPRNRDVLLPFMGGEDVNSIPDLSAPRWVINFFDWPHDRLVTGSWADADEKQRRIWLRNGSVPPDYEDPVAADYPDCLAIVEAKVKPERTRTNDGGNFALRYPLYLRWWQYADKRPELYATIETMKRVLVMAQTSRTQSPVFLPRRMVYNHKLIVFALKDDADLALIASSIHYHWVIRPGMPTQGAGGDAVYTPTDCFENYPFPINMIDLNDVGAAFGAQRSSIMQERRLGLTEIIGLMNTPGEESAGICGLRDTYAHMDRAVASAYGWDDVDLGHGFHETRQGVRFTISESAREEVLDRLLELNHQRYAEEIEAGLHDKGSKRPKAATRGATIAEDRGRSVQPDLDLGFELA